MTKMDEVKRLRDGLVLLLIAIWTCNQAEILRLPECGKFDMDASIRHRGKALSGAELMFFSNITLHDCHLACVQNIKCKSINYNANIGCQLNSEDSRNSSVTLVDQEGWLFTETPVNVSNLGRVCRHQMPCRNDGPCRDICLDPGYECICRERFTGQQCELFEDWGISRKNGSGNDVFYPKLVIPGTDKLGGLTVCLSSRVFTGRGQVALNVHSIEPNVIRCNMLRIIFSNFRASLELMAEKFDNLTQSTKNLSHMCISLSNLTQSRGSLSVYAQGELVLSTTVTNSWYQPSAMYRVFIGADVDRINGTCTVASGTVGFIGDISQVNIWNFALEKTEIYDVSKFRPGILEKASVRWDDFRTSFQPRSGIIEVFKILRKYDQYEQSP